MKISPVGISLGLLVVIIYFGAFPTAFAGPDITPPTLNPVSIISNNVLDMTLAKVGDVVTLSFTANENIMTPVVTIGGLPAVEAGAGTAWTATRIMSGAEPNGPLAISIVFSDLAGNMGTTVMTTTDASSVTFDQTVPMVTSAAITAGNTITIVYDGPVISSMGDYSDFNLIPGGPRAVSGHVGSGITTITLIFGGGAANLDEDGTIDIGIGITDLAGNVITPLNDLMVDDGQVPSLLSVSIASDNAFDTTLAIDMDTVTLSFTSDEPIMTPTVMMVQIDGNDADSVNGGPLLFTATRQMMMNDNEGTIGFSIDFEDMASNAGTTVTTITVGSNVIYDETPPPVMPVSIVSDNAFDTTLAKDLDTITLTFTVNEAIMMAPGVLIDGNVPDTLMETPPASNVWEATRQMMAGDTEGIIGFSIDTTDLAGNMGTQMAITTGSDVTYDETPPLVTSGAIISNNDFRILYNEPVRSVSGDYTNLMIGAVSPAVTMSTSLSATIVVTFNTPPNSFVDDTGSVDIGAGLTDLAGNSIVPVVGLALADGQRPSLTPVSIISNNVLDTTLAKVGDTVTLTFTSDEDIMMPVVTIGGQPAVEAGAGTAWTATRMMSGAEPNGPLSFTIDFTDLAGNAGTTVTTTTDASSVTFDDILPTVTSSAITFEQEVTIVYDEPVISVIGDYSGLIILQAAASIDSIAFVAQDTVVLTFGSILAESDDTGMITIGAGVTDTAGNIINMPGIFNLADGQPARESHSSVGAGSAPSFSPPLSTGSSIVMSPISINGKHYNFIQSGNLIPDVTIPFGDNVLEESKAVEQITNVIKVGQLTQLKFVTYTNLGPDHIQHAAIYTNLKGTSINPFTDTIGIIYEKGKELEIIDRNNILSDAVIKVSGKGNRVDVILNIIFSKNMDTSDLVLRMWDENRYALYAHIVDAWKVVGETETKDLSLFEEPLDELNSDNPVKEIDIEKTVSAIKKWAGYDSEIVSDSQLLNTIGIDGDYIPKWFKKSAKWIVYDQIRLEEFIDALRFLHRIQA